MFQGWKSTSLKPWWRRDVESTKQRSEVRPHFLIRHGMSFQSWGQRRSVQIFMFMIFHNNLDVYHHIWDYDISYDIKKNYPMNIYITIIIPWISRPIFHRFDSGEPPSHDIQTHDLWSASFPLWEKNGILMIKTNKPYANHGAGIFTYKTGPFFLGFLCCEKYSSTMVRIWVILTVIPSSKLTVGPWKWPIYSGN